MRKRVRVPLQRGCILAMIAHSHKSAFMHVIFGQPYGYQQLVLCMLDKVATRSSRGIPRNPLPHLLGTEPRHGRPAHCRAFH